MFIEVETKKKETVSINISHILFVTPYKEGCVIFDVTGNDFLLRESYESVMERIGSLLTVEYPQFD